MGKSTTIYMDVLLHDSILGERDEPPTVINLLHIKANVLKELFCVAVLFSVGRKMEKPGGIKRALPAAAALGFQVSLQRAFPAAGWLGHPPRVHRHLPGASPAPRAARRAAGRASASVQSGPSSQAV